MRALICGILHAEVAAIDQQVLRAGEVRVQGVELADHAQLRLDGQGVMRACASPRPWMVPPSGSGQAQAHADGGGFACAVGADHAQAFARGDVKRQVFDDFGIAVALAQVLDLEKVVAMPSIVVY